MCMYIYYIDTYRHIYNIYTHALVRTIIRTNESTTNNDVKTAFKLCS